MPAVELDQAPDEVFLAVPGVERAPGHRGGVASQAKAAVVTDWMRSGTWPPGSHVARVFPWAQQLPTIPSAARYGPSRAISAIRLATRRRVAVVAVSASGQAFGSRVPRRQTPKDQALFGNVHNSVQNVGGVPGSAGGPLFFGCSRGRNRFRT